ncbi:predicted protein [Uncinocarpus reesii 1704]|uniref:Uncharacterized protein n=1 Tax=Uncinocarpus reesii (strain UAMH 1704) TaxID=336963 RepID=C4JMU5_UNCRE|nr:uncharacterized protein UREG_04153 [Uncinocarpus reesii 1704]EEP79307.1 predicted protein [Uncinocarpus reesii 1704]
MPILIGAMFRLSTLLLSIRIHRIVIDFSLRNNMGKQRCLYPLRVRRPGGTAEPGLRCWCWMSFWVFVLGRCNFWPARCKEQEPDTWEIRAIPEVKAFVNPNASAADRLHHILAAADPRAKRCKKCKDYRSPIPLRRASSGNSRWPLDQSARAHWSAPPVPAAWTPTRAFPGSALARRGPHYRYPMGGLDSRRIQCARAVIGPRARGHPASRVSVPEITTRSVSYKRLSKDT